MIYKLSKYKKLLCMQIKINKISKMLKVQLAGELPEMTRGCKMNAVTIATVDRVAITVP